MRHNWNSSECDQLIDHLNQAIRQAVLLQGAAKAKPKGAEASDWEEVAEEKLLVALGSIARFREGVGQ